MRRTLFVFMHAMIFLLVLSAATWAGEPIIVRSAGKTILVLEAEGTRISPGELATLVPYTEGSELRPELVREGIVNFYRTGLYDRVEVLLKELPGGVAVKYVLVPKRWVDKIEFEGNLYLDDRELMSKVNLRGREELTNDKLENNVDRLLEYYRYRGFVGSEVAYRVETDTNNRTLLFFTIKEGKRLMISDVRLWGSAGISRTKLLSIITSMPGTRVDGEDLDSDVKKVRENLRNRMYLIPVLNYTIQPDHKFPDAVIVNFNINKGDLFNLQVQMDDAKETHRIQKRMRTVFLGSVTPEKAKLAIQKEVLDRYHEEGYAFTAVNLEDRLDEEGVRSITLVVDRGLKALIGELRVDGVRFFSEERLGNVLGFLPGDPYVKDVMEEGIANLEREYGKEGFQTNDITRHALNFIPRNAHQEVTIHLTVQEGPRNMVSSVKVSGSPVQEERTRQLIGVGAGDPYDPELISSGRENLLQELGRRGYLYASVTIEEPVINPDATVDLDINVMAGPKVRLGTAIISGNESVDTRIITVALGLKKGEILNRDKILKAQERVYRLKVMSSVDVQLADPQTPEEVKDLMVKVRERPQYVIGLRLGYGNEDKVRGEFSVTNRNVKGMARSLSFRGKSSAIERSATLLYTHPWFQSLPMDMTVSLSDVFEERESYSRDSLTIGLDFVRELSERTELRFGYFFEGLQLSDVSPDAQLSSDDEGKTDIAGLVGEVLHDTRNDFLDPWTGLLGDVILEYTSTWLGSKAEYVKAEIAARRYATIFDSMVLAGLLRLGQVTAYGESEEVIISKRFFLGGQNSVRGYELDSLGPRDANGDPVGGNFMFNANLELRYPLYRTLRGVLFVDSGSIWLESAADPEDEEFKLRAAGGAGIRWSSPIGPLSVDYGYKLNPVQEDEGDRFRWHFSIGHAF